MRISKLVLGLTIILVGVVLLAIAQAKQDTKQDTKNMDSNAVIIEDEE
jgi:uncharacterized membrane protein